MMLFHKVVFFSWTWIISVAFSQEPCLKNYTCFCDVDSNVTDMFCQLTVPFPEIHADGAAIGTLTLSAGLNVTRAESNFRYLQVRHLVITGSSISELDCFLLDGIDGLESIAIEHTEVAVVPTCLLRRFVSVTSLKLVHSHITFLSRRAFAVIPTLKRLNLSGNYISQLRTDTFTSLHNLESLDLSANRLSGEVNSSIFLELTKLKVLRLERNNISLIRGKLWRNLTNLELLDLSENNIVSFVDLSFSPQYTFILSLSSNGIKTIKNLVVRFPSRKDGTSNFTFHLDASNNMLTKFPMVNVEGPRQCHLLFDLNAESNKIARFDREPVRSTACKKHVKMRVSVSNNQLTNFPPCNLYILQKFDFLVLNLSRNYIHGNLNSLCGANEVETLDISRNMLSAIGSMYGANERTRLQTLLLAGNDISEVRVSHFGQISSRLKFIDLSNNSISSLSGILVDLPDSLNILKLAGNLLICNLTEIQFFDFHIRCNLQKRLDDARCVSPSNMQAYQVKCALAENCSTPTHSEICASDTYLEVNLSLRSSADFILHAEWQVTGPGKGKLEELILELTEIPDDVVSKIVHVHAFAEEFAFHSIQPGISYRVCMLAVVSGSIAAPKACVNFTDETIGPGKSDTNSYHFKTVSVVLGTSFAALALVVVIYSIFHLSTRRCGNCQQINGPLQDDFFPIQLVEEKRSTLAPDYIEEPSAPSEAQIQADHVIPLLTKVGHNANVGPPNTPLPRSEHVTDQIVALTDIGENVLSEAARNGSRAHFHPDDLAPALPPRKLVNTLNGSHTKWPPDKFRQNVPQRTYKDSMLLVDTDAYSEPEDQLADIYEEPYGQAGIPTDSNKNIRLVTELIQGTSEDNSYDEVELKSRDPPELSSAGRNNESRDQDQTLPKVRTGRPDSAYVSEGTLFPPGVEGAHDGANETKSDEENIEMLSENSAGSGDLSTQVEDMEAQQAISNPVYSSPHKSI